METYIVEYRVRMTVGRLIRNCGSKAEAIRKAREGIDDEPLDANVDRVFWSTARAEGWVLLRSR